MDEVRNNQWKCDVLPEVVHVGAEAARPTPCVLPQHITLQLQLVHLCIVQDIHSGSHVEKPPVQWLFYALLVRKCGCWGMCSCVLSARWCYFRVVSEDTRYGTSTPALPPTSSVNARHHHLLHHPTLHLRPISRQWWHINV